jgi:hypothetical protein
MGPSSRLLMPPKAGLIFLLSDLQCIRRHGEAEKTMAQGSNPSLSAISY